MRALMHRMGERIVTRVTKRMTIHERTSAATKIALRSLLLSYRERAAAGGTLPPVSDTGFRVLSQFDEDGILLFLLATAGVGPGTYLDLGGGDGLLASNTANLALNLGFHGLVVDADAGAIARGRRFYAAHPDTSLYPPRFVETRLTRENVNDVVRTGGLEGEIDVLSIDVDGNDYWLWEALDCVSPRIVVIETHPEFGTRSIVVPYDPDFDVRRSPDRHYLGAAPAAAVSLGRRLGYRLVGANRYGFNLFFLRDDLAAGMLPEMPVEALFRHPRARERLRLFDAMAGLPFETV